jgi:type IV pilus assembly protein PilX
MQCTHIPKARQSGAALILALIFLLLMTMLSTSSMRTATMQERMAGNTRDMNLGFQSAEAALRVAERRLLDETESLPEFDNTAGFYQVNSTARPPWDGSPNLAGGVPLDSDLGTAEPAQYYIEKLSSIRPAGTSTETGAPSEDVHYFRVTAVGYGLAEDAGGLPLAAVVLRSVYRSR